MEGSLWNPFVSVHDSWRQEEKEHRVMRTRKGYKSNVWISLRKKKNKRVNCQQCAEMHICSYCYLHFSSWQLVSFVCASRLDPLTEQTCSSSPVISQLPGFHSSNTPSRQLLCRGQEKRKGSYFNKLIFKKLLSYLGPQRCPAFRHIRYKMHTNGECECFSIIRGVYRSGVKEVR